MKNSTRRFLFTIGIVLSQAFFCSPTGPDYNSYYHSPIFENEILIIQGDTATVTPVNYKVEDFGIFEKWFGLKRLNLNLAIDCITPPMDSTYTWNDSTKVKYLSFSYMDKKITGFQISITRLPYTSKTIGYVPKGNWQLTDSAACKIECIWGENNKYSSTIQALYYTIPAED
jgi:hypothetical protein